MEPGLSSPCVQKERQAATVWPASPIILSLAEETVWGLSIT